ncbi:HAD family phosphatase [Sediminibacter sp. Hel_I_10]|uniref:HAD family hydrolase n=1 Tax=Sediminibacter sp. Hel_I_10 TaxID=1392490 RepID=UPI00047E58ED|nr:HAD family phosphatase [Sediminibacter sp. Hel_I_10]
MIKTLIFDFGAIFINLDKAGATKKLLDMIGADALPEAAISVNTLYEQGLLSTEEFLQFYTDNFPEVSQTEIRDTWNSILLEFPKERLEFLKTLAQDKTYELILLSNTNALHIDHIKEQVPFYEEFKSQFDGFYLSHEIELRKPNADIYQYVLKQHQTKAEHCLFIDDTKANTDAAAALGIHVWNLDETTQDITQLFDLKSKLF